MRVGKPPERAAHRTAEERRPKRAGTGGTACSVRSSVPQVSVVIPAYNEDDRLRTHLSRLVPVLRGAFGQSFELIIVDDGSDPPIEQILASAGLAAQLRILRHDRNLGKGASLRDGFLHASGQCVLFADADGATPPEHLIRLAEAVRRGAAIAVGCRVRGQARGWVRRDRRRRLASRLFALAARFALGVAVVDPQIGFKALDRRRLEPLVRAATETGYLFDLELLLQARRGRLPVQALAVRWRECPGSRLRVLRDGARMIAGLLRLRNRFRTVSRHRAGHGQTGIAAKQKPPPLPPASRLRNAVASRPPGNLLRAGVYENRILYRWIFEPTYRKVLHSLGREPRGRILDVGAGSALLGRLLRRRSPWCHYVAVDPTPRGWDRCLGVKAVAEALPFRPDCFDIVLCTHAAHHFRSIERACREFCRVLKPGGRVIIVDGLVDSLTGFALHQLVIARVEKDVRFVNRRQWHKLLMGGGLQPNGSFECDLPVPILVVSGSKPLAASPSDRIHLSPLSTASERETAPEEPAP